MGRWYYDLSDYLLTGKDANDHKARVLTDGEPATIETMADLIIKGGCELSRQTLVMAADLFADKTEELLLKGTAVATRTAIYQPAITGTFTGNTGEFDPDKNACVINIRPTKRLKAAMTNVTPKFSGTIKTLGGATVTRVTDTATGKNDSIITPGGTIKVQGKKIKCLNSDGTSIGTVSFINTQTNEKTAVDCLAENTPAKLMFICPDLQPGSYTLRIETYYSYSTTLLNEVRVIDYSRVLTVE